MKPIELNFIETKDYASAIAHIAHKGLDKETLNKKVKSIISNFPTIGEIIPGAGGVRKFRLAIPGKGKRSGCRVIYEPIPKLG